MATWNEINTSLSLENFMTTFGWFHDSCIKELKYISGAYVDINLCMNPINSMRTVKVIFQRQYKEPMVVEVEFSDLINLVLYPVDEKATCDLHGASMFIKDGKIYWYDTDHIDSPTNKHNGTWICANKVRWRIVDEYIGEEEIYKHN